jgi:hypothetical protein
LDSSLPFWQFDLDLLFHQFDSQEDDASFCSDSFYFSWQLDLPIPITFSFAVF